MDGVPELKAVVGAMIFGANRSLSLNEIRRVLQAVAEDVGGDTVALGEVKPGEISAAIEALQAQFAEANVGMHLAEVAGGFRFQSDPACGTWLRRLLDKGKPHRLSQPCLETLAVIAYRQPVTRAQIEDIRGVGVDHVVRTLLEMQLIRIAGRSDLPGRPFLYGTTQSFLEHFGLSGLDQLEDVNPMLKRPKTDAKPTPASQEELELSEAAEEDETTEEDEA